MKTNEFTTLYGQTVVLVPYKVHHVEKYHLWMKDEEMLSKTASEPLSLEEEYEMQRKWRDDDDKCTFIVLSRQSLENDNSEIDSMAGDVNLFFNDADNPKAAEIEVMIAERSFQRKGFGRESVMLMMRYGVTALGVDMFTAKIGADNLPSICLFENLGFIKCGEANVFNEIELNLDSTSEKWTLLKSQPEQRPYPLS